jgi:4-hydroxy-tetrahydrodipicolinate synthase
MFSGSMVAVVTPMAQGVAPDNPIDFDALANLVEFHIDNGTDALVAVGTTGESATLSEQVHCDVVRRVIEMARGRIPVIAGTGANSTSEAIRLTQDAYEAGADACLLVTPYYNKPTQEGLYQHFKAVAEQVAIPQILYNVPARTACDMQPETIARLAEVDNIIGVKEATGEVSRVDEIRGLCGEDFLLVSGDDISAAEFIARGGDGVVSVTANVAPRAMHEMCKAALAGDRDEANRVDATLVGLHTDLFIESSPIPTKWAMHRMGLIQAGIRLPLTWLSESCHAAVIAAMEGAGVALQN